jgi:hypothetical protein
LDQYQVIDQGSQVHVIDRTYKILTTFDHDEYLPSSIIVPGNTPEESIFWIVCRIYLE